MAYCDSSWVVQVFSTVILLYMYTVPVLHFDEISNRYYKDLLK